MLAWPTLAGATAALALALDAAGLESPALFAALLAGIGAALAAPYEAIRLELAFGAPSSPSRLAS